MTKFMLWLSNPIRRTSKKALRKFNCSLNCLANPLKSSPPNPVKFHILFMFHSFC